MIIEQVIKLDKILDYICLQLWYAEWYDNMPIQEWTVEQAKEFRKEAFTLLTMLKNVYGLSGGPVEDFHGILVNYGWKHHLEYRWNIFEHPKGE